MRCYGPTVDDDTSPDEIGDCPTPDEIRRACWRIQATWTRIEERHRRIAPSIDQLIERFRSADSHVPRPKPSRYYYHAIERLTMSNGELGYAARRFNRRRDREFWVRQNPDRRQAVSPEQLTALNVVEYLYGQGPRRAAS